MRPLFTGPFQTRWLFDVELLARWIRHHKGATRRQLAMRARELPLPAWHDVPGSKVTWKAAVIVPVMAGAIALVHWGKWSFVASESHPMGGMEFQVVLM